MLGLKEFSDKPVFDSSLFVTIRLKMFARTSTAVFYSMKKRDRELFMTVLKMYHQQKDMFKAKIHVCSDRIVSIFQPHVRPIVRGKAKAKVEFGAKIGVDVVGGHTFIDHHSWDAYNECEDLIPHLRAYKNASVAAGEVGGR